MMSTLLLLVTRTLTTLTINHHHRYHQMMTQNYETTEDTLQREFETYGPIKHIRLVREKKPASAVAAADGADGKTQVDNNGSVELIDTGKSRGYAFIEFERAEDMKEAFKYADEREIDGRRIKVDVERGRVEKNWKPRRLGGGLGGESRKDPVQVLEERQKDAQE
jgi:U1 small nuclear ribonucleoprotein 70kDa